MASRREESVFDTSWRRVRLNSYTMQFFLVLVFLTSQLKFSLTDPHDIDNIDPSKTIAWGPGLSPGNLTLRARYFFIHLSHSDGSKLTESPSEEDVTAEIKGKNSKGYSCRIWVQVMDCEDGSFIIRYRLYETCYKLNITVMVQNQIIESASGFSEGPIYEEECYCPIPSIEDWKNRAECADTYPQIVEDLSLFPSIDFDEMRNRIIGEFNRPHSVSLCHYVIKDNRIYRKCYGQHVGFHIFSDSILLSLARKVVLPDVEFFMNLGDWPLVPKKGTLFPIFSWCGSIETNDIVVPTYDITESSLENMGRVSLDMLSVQGNAKTRWEQKIEKAFWRGRDSRRERLDLIDLARKNPDLFNASMTNFFFFRDEIEKYGPPEKHVSFFDFFKYKYQLNIDGTVAAYRFPYLLAGDSLVFKQNSKYYEHFYSQLIPYQHYVPIKHNLDDLVEKIRWAKMNDDEARRISRAGRTLMRNIALPRDIFCYYISLFHELNTRIKSTVKKLDGMEEVLQSEQNCVCDKALSSGRTGKKSNDEL